MIEVNKIKKTYNTNIVLDNISFKLNSGEVVGLLGPNGAGKTTTMRIISGFISPDSGDVLVEGKSVSKDAVLVQLDIGYLPENNPLYKDFLVKDMLETSSLLKGLTGKEKEENIKFAVKAVNIGDVYYKPVKELSKGYKQRVGIAMALLSKPKLLILDEPTEGLDPNQRAEIRTLIKKLSKDQAILLSTHVMQEVETMCDRVVVINKGKIVADSKTSELKSKFKVLGALTASIEGSDIVEKIKSLKQVQEVQELSKFSNTVSIKIVLKGTDKIQPELSRLARENNWTIWKLIEESQGLEELFHEITTEEK